MIELNTFHNCDCMELMKEIPDKYFDLAIVDPPYGGVTQGGYMKNPLSTARFAKSYVYHSALWNQQKPSQSYFDELKRVSKNQIIWGGNYFQTMIQADSQCWVVWDKENGETDFADCELAYTSFNRASRIFRFKWQGMLQGNMKCKENKIHPTQKPVALYEWLLTKFAKQGDKILDTHVGSASSLIACHNLGFEYVGCELDEVYYKLACERIERHKMQLRLPI